MSNISGIKAIIFDMDGVIIDSTKEIEIFWEGWANKENVPYNREIITKYIHGRTADETIRLLFNNSTPDVRRQIDIAAGEFDKNMRPGLIDGVRDFLLNLSVASIPIGLVTSSPKERVKPLLDRHNVYHFFKEIITGDDIVQGKPHPEPYIKMAAKLNVSKNSCLVFEDSDSGIQSGLAAGMKLTAVNNYRFIDDNVIAVINNFTQIRISDNKIILDVEPYLKIDLV